MATTSPTSDKRAAALASIRKSDERIAEHREAVLRSVATLRRVAAELRRRRA
jgi:hypothetical protein